MVSVQKYTSYTCIRMYTSMEIVLAYVPSCTRFATLHWQNQYITHSQKLMPKCHVCEVSNLLKMESSREIGRKKQSSFSSRADWAFIKVLCFTLFQILFLRSQGPYLFFDWPFRQLGSVACLPGLLTEKIRHFG